MSHPQKFGRFTALESDSDSDSDSSPTPTPTPTPSSRQRSSYKNPRRNFSSTSTSTPTPTPTPTTAQPRYSSRVVTFGSRRRTSTRTTSRAQRASRPTHQHRHDDFPSLTGTRTPHSQKPVWNRLPHRGRKFSRTVVKYNAFQKKEDEPPSTKTVDHIDTPSTCAGAGAGAGAGADVLPSIEEVTKTKSPSPPPPPPSPEPSVMWADCAKTYQDEIDSLLASPTSSHVPPPPAPAAATKKPRDAWYDSDDDDDDDFVVPTIFPKRSWNDGGDAW